MYVVRFAENVFLYISKTDVLDHLRVEVTLADDLLEELEHDAIERSILETALLALGQGRSDGERNDDIIGVLLRAGRNMVVSIKSIRRWLLRGRSIHLVDRLLARREVRKHVRETLCRHCESI